MMPEVALKVNVRSGVNVTIGAHLPFKPRSATALRGPS